MSKAKPRSQQPTEVREMRPEYRFDYTRARPNRFAARMGKEKLDTAVVEQLEKARLKASSKLSSVQIGEHAPRLH